MVTSPPVGPDGEGIYPHSYERLGAQRGWHISVVFLDPSRGSTTPRERHRPGPLRVRCHPGKPTPHKTVFLRPGQTKTVTARCPKRQFLVSGGFQRTDFRSDGGDYVTESRAAGRKAWTVSGHAYGVGSGELTAIAYCARMKRPRLVEVASEPGRDRQRRLGGGDDARLPQGQAPGHRRLQRDGSTNAFFAEGASTRAAPSPPTLTGSSGRSPASRPTATAASEGLSCGGLRERALPVAEADVGQHAVGPARQVPGPAARAACSSTGISSSRISIASSRTAIPRISPISFGGSGPRARR